MRGSFCLKDWKRTVACDVDTTSFGGILVSTPVSFHMTATLMIGSLILALATSRAVIVHLELRSKVLGAVLVLDSRSDIVQSTLDIASCSTVLCIIGGVGHMVFVKSLALVCISTLGGLSALSVGSAVIDELEMWIGIWASLVDNWAADRGSFLLSSSC